MKSELKYTNALLLGIQIQIGFIAIILMLSSCQARANELRTVPNLTVQASPIKSNKLIYRDAKYRIGIIDTGYDASIMVTQAPLCPTGHYDFNTDSGTIGSGPSNHGTILAALITEELRRDDYCLVIYQVQDATGYAPLFNLVRALSKAHKDGLTAINISLVGNRGSYVERTLLEKITSTGTRIFVAAGNENQNLDETCNAYPACYDVKNLFSVGALNPDHKSKASFSNYGTKVDLWYMGFYEFRGQVMPGTSVSSPRALSDYVQSLP